MDSATQQSFKQHVNGLRQDGIMWKSHALWQLAKGDPDGQQQAVEDISAMLLCIKQNVKRDNYVDMVTKALKLKPKWLKDSMTNALEEDNDRFLQGETNAKLPPWANKDRVYNYGFDWQLENENTGYWFAGQGGILAQLTNFVLTPLYHIYDKTGGNRRLTAVQNGYGIHKTIELASKAFISLDRFQEVLMDEGFFHINDGFTMSHLRRLFRAIGNNYPKTYELKVLGWEPEGFWSYSDAIYDGEKIVRFNDIGIAQYKDTFYYSPSASGLFRSDRKHEDGGEVMEDDPYENDKNLRYQVSPVNFSQWAIHMRTMHGDAAFPLVAYAIVSIFKDIIVTYEKCPLLYGYGLVQSGKSTWAEGLYYLFNSVQSKAFNLNQGTVYAFFNRMERFRNVPQLFNEFDEDAINDEFFRAFKAFYDGEGRDRGKGIKGKTETQKINCTAVIIGQTLTTKDGASVLIRSIPVRFNNPGERSDEAKKNYDTWFAWVNAGMNSCIIDVLRYRRHFKASFSAVFNEELVKLKDAIRAAKEGFQERIVKNYCILLASTKVMGEVIPLGFDYKEMFDYCRHNIIMLSRMISQVDNLAIFWSTIEFLQEMSMIEEGIDFKIVTETSIKKQLDKDIIDVPFDVPTSVLYLRLTKSFPLFQEQYKKSHGGRSSINQGTIITYFDSSKSYLGMNKSSRFADKVTNSYMFDYAKLGINLQREDAHADNRKACTLTAEVSRGAEVKKLGLDNVMTFTVKHFEQQKVEGSPVPKTAEVYTKCFTNDASLLQALLPGARVKLTGMLDEKQGKGGFKNRSIDVSTIEVLNTKPGTIEFDAGITEPVNGFL